MFFEAALTSGGALIAIDAGTQRVIGSSRFHAYDAERDEVEIGCWRGRIAVAATRRDEAPDLTDATVAATA